MKGTFVPWAMAAPLAWLVVAAPAAGLSASWGATSRITSNSDIVSPATVVAAFNLGNAGSTIDVAVDGRTIPFEPGTVSGFTEYGNASFFDPAGTSVDADFESVLDTFAQRNPPNDTTGALSFSGLEENATYLLQVFVADDRGSVWNRTFSVGGAQTTFATNSGGLTTATAVATVRTGPGETSFDLIVGGGPLNAAVIARAPLAAPALSAGPGIGLAVALLAGGFLVMRSQRRARL